MAKNGKPRWKKWVVIIVALLAVGGGTAWYLNGRGVDDVQFQTTMTTRGDITQAVTATGTLNPVVNVQVGSQISGRISKLYADFNSSVTQAQVIAEIDPSTYKASVARAEADLSSARAGLELAQVEARRATQLFTNNLISSSEYDSTIASLHQAEATMQIRDAALNSARVDLSRCTIYSPVDGTVISRNVDVGQTVAASMSAPILFQIANDLAKMQIDANVSEADIGTIEEGQNVTFTVDAFPERKFTGRVRQIRNSPTTVQNVVTYDAVIEVANSDLKLRPGMTANASIVTAERFGVLKVPNAALRFRPPEPSTNKTFLARLVGGGEKKPVTNTSVTKIEGTNAATSEAQFTGNEPPEELFRRVREMRERGEEVPQEIRAKLRELFQSGALQRPGGGGFGEGGFRGGRGGGRQGGSQPTSRTIYTLASGSQASGDQSGPQPVRVKTGISDGAYTEITDGIKEGDLVVTAVKQSQTQASIQPPGGVNPFGGGGGGGGRGFGRGGR